MAITPINITRVTHNMRSQSLLDSLRQNSLTIFRYQSRLATGRAFNSASEDPVAASQSLKFNESLRVQEQIVKNLTNADLMLSASDSALSEVNSLLNQVEALASRSVGALVSRDERIANAQLMGAIREQLMVVGNREVNGSFIFAGRDTRDNPFAQANGGIEFVGDRGDVLARVSRFEQEGINVAGDVLFGALSKPVGERADLKPILTAETRLEDLNGATGFGIRKGTIVVSDGGANVIQVDLQTADTVGDVMDMINAAAADAGINLTVRIQGRGLVQDGSGVSLVDVTTGVMVSDLGLNPALSGQLQAGGPIDLQPSLTPTTLLASLKAGAGIELDEGFRLTNGVDTVLIDVSGAETVQDVINAINRSGIGVFAQINASKTGIEVVNRVSGALMSISENDGTTADELGIRTLTLSTPLSELNFGRGVELLPDQPDISIEAKDGSTFDVNLDGARTIGDVIDAITSAADTAGVAVTAKLGSTSNGIVIADATGGTGSLVVRRAANSAFAADDLGLIKSVDDPATELVGDDVNTVRPDGVFTALFDLERALRNGSDIALTDAAQRLARFSNDITRVHGVIGARSRAIRGRLEQTQDAVGATRLFLSKVEDLDYGDAVTRFQKAQTSLQASLLSGAQLLNLSLFNFLA